jgi:hypothetical protein
LPYVGEPRAFGEALARGEDHPGIEFVDLLPGEAQTIEHAGGEILDEDVIGLNHLAQDRLALGLLEVDDDRLLVAIEHGEIERVGAGDVAQLVARKCSLERR